MCHRLSLEKLFKKRDAALPAGPKKHVSWNTPTCEENICPVSDSAADQSFKAFTICDKLSGHRLLVDTGAFISLFPVSMVPSSKITRDTDIPMLAAANGTKIRTYGRSSITLCFAGNDFNWNFVVASVQQPLLGADFLAHFNLLVDVANRRLLNAYSFSSLPLYASNQPEINSSICAIGPYSFFFYEFKDVFRAELKQVPGTGARHGIFHRFC